MRFSWDTNDFCLLLSSTTMPSPDILLSFLEFAPLKSTDCEHHIVFARYHFFLDVPTVVQHHAVVTRYPYVLWSCHRVYLLLPRTRASSPGILIFIIRAAVVCAYCCRALYSSHKASFFLFLGLPLCHMNCCQATHCRRRMYCSDPCCGDNAFTALYTVISACY